MRRSRRDIGCLGEALATRKLRSLGWRIEARNWRCRRGEIDIIARDGEWLVIVEVRTRATRGFGRAEESVDARKKRRLVLLGSIYVQSAGWRGPWRIDVVALDIDKQGRVVRCDHYQNAVGAGDW